MRSTAVAVKLSFWANTFKINYKGPNFWWSLGIYQAAWVFTSIKPSNSNSVIFVHYHLHKIKSEDCTKLASVLPFSWLENSLLALETVLPMSARERRLDFLVWWRCFRSNVYMTLSFSSAFSWPISIWLSVISSGGAERGERQKRSFFQERRQFCNLEFNHTAFNTTQHNTHQLAYFVRAIVKNVNVLCEICDPKINSAVLSYQFLILSVSFSSVQHFTQPPQYSIMTQGHYSKAT